MPGQRCPLSGSLDAYPNDRDEGALLPKLVDQMKGSFFAQSSKTGHSVFHPLSPFG